MAAPGEEKSMKSDQELNQQLDDLILDFFTKYEEYQSKMDTLCEIIKAGHLDLSKARYSMGNKAVCALQYDNKMVSSLYHVEVSEKDSGIFELHRESPSKKEKSDYKSILSETGGVRHRKVDKGSKDVDEVTGMLELATISRDKKPVEEESMAKVEDPIKWFGVLVPQSLRSGQKHFQCAIEDSCELLNLQAELVGIIEKYKKLKLESRKTKDCEQENDHED